ncbi:hypothetical protein H6F77_06545 [Microcoleus sp. FACHB-831]|nr:hypothetical protein [Microcoleus sp. FACHB-831]MBD1920742.1 hypothetical protein [Microcoleus sp. FACHB-831]
MALVKENFVLDSLGQRLQDGSQSLQHVKAEIFIRTAQFSPAPVLLKDV